MTKLEQQMHTPFIHAETRIIISCDEQKLI